MTIDSVNNIQCNVVSSCIDAVSKSESYHPPKEAGSFLACNEADQQKKQKEGGQAF
jgi:hypothetical protein